jgi:hypothetical protein
VRREGDKGCSKEGENIIGRERERGEREREGEGG